MLAAPGWITSLPGNARCMEQDALDALDLALVGWLSCESFDDAVHETVARTGYARSDVEQQLAHVVERCRAKTMRRVRSAELAACGASMADLPRRVLVLATGRVPGLALEGIAAAFAVGSDALVRPSRDETVLTHLLRYLRQQAPVAARHIELVGVGAAPIPWERVDAAVVYGSDETIAMVRDRVPISASRRVAAYGSRQGIAVALPDASELDPAWAQHLADDVLTFRQQGCMSPSWLYVVGSTTQTRPLIDAVGRALATGAARHVAADVDDRLQERRMADADVLGAIAAGMAPDTSSLYAGAARVTVVRVADEQELQQRVRALGTLLQTAVVAAAPEDLPRINELLFDAGVTRVCAPGDAHRPEPAWPQDGIGRIAPLLGAQCP